MACAAFKMPGQLLSTWPIQESALKGLNRFEQSINDGYVWINEALAEAKKTFKTSEISMLPKTPSAPRRTRRRVPSVSGVQRPNLRSNAFTDRDSEADTSTEASLPLNARRTRASKLENKPGLDVDVESQDVTRASVKGDDIQMKKFEKMGSVIEPQKSDKERPTAAGNKADRFKSTLSAADQIMFQHQESISKASERILKTAEASMARSSSSKMLEMRRESEAAARDTLPLVQPRRSIELDPNAVTNISSSFIVMQPVVVISTVPMKPSYEKSEDKSERVNPANADGKTDAQAGKAHDKEMCGRKSSRRSSALGKATLNVARLSTSRLSSKSGNASSKIQISAKKASCKELAERSPMRCTRSKARQQKENALVSTDDSDCEIGATPSPQRRLLQSKISTNKSSMVANSSTMHKPTTGVMNVVASIEPHLASRATRSKTRAIEIEESSSNPANANTTTEFKKPNTPSTAQKSRPLGSKVQQLQEVLLKDSGFGLRASPKPSTPKTVVSNSRCSIKRAIDSSNASEVTPKRLCQNRCTPEDAGNVRSTASKFKQTGSNFKVRKHTNSGSIPVTSFIQKSSVKILTQDELLELKRSELAAKDKKITELHQKRTIQQQKRIDELRRNREEHQRQVQIRRMEQEQSAMKKGAIQKPDSQDCSVISSLDNIGRKENEGVMRMLVDEEEAETMSSEKVFKDVNKKDDRCDVQGELKKDVEKENRTGKLQDKPKSSQKDDEQFDKLKMDKEALSMKESRAEIRLEKIIPLNDKAEKMKLEKERIEREKLERDAAELARLEKENKKKEKQEKEEQRRLKREQDELERVKRLIEQKEQQELDRKRQKEERELKERLEKEKRDMERQQERELQERIRQEKLLAAERQMEERLANERSRLETERRLKETQKQTQELIDKHNENLKHSRVNSNSAMSTINKIAMVAISDVHNSEKGFGSGVKTFTSKGCTLTKISPNNTVKDVSISSGGITKAGTSCAVAVATTAKTASVVVAPTAKPIAKPAVAASAGKMASTIAMPGANNVPGTKASVVQHSKAYGMPVASSQKAPNATNALNKTFDREAKSESYDMTPVNKKKFAASTAENYNIDDLNSEDSTDDDDKPRKTIPQWAQGNQLKISLIHQCNGSIDVLKLFGVIEMPDLNLMFEKKKTRFNKRTSSAQWDEFSSFLATPK